MKKVLRHALVVCAVSVASLLAAACGGKKAGSSCKGAESTCSDDKSALVCRGAKLVAVPCGGPLGCSKFEDHANCDTSVATAGQACLGAEDEYACSPDGKRALVCKGGTFAPWLECRGPGGCTMVGRTPSCDTSIAEKGDPCKKLGASACSVDGKQLLTCRDGTFALHRHCRGEAGCSMENESASCDESISVVGDPCGIPGRVVCSTDGRTELICQGGAYFASRTCKGGCTVTSRPGRPIECE